MDVVDFTLENARLVIHFCLVRLLFQFFIQQIHADVHLAVVHWCSWLVLVALDY
jgi:hypothetical protein